MEHIFINEVQNILHTALI